MNRKKRYLSSSDHYAMISDIMVGLVFAFILIIVIFAVELGHATQKKKEALAEYSKLQEARTTLLENLKKSMKKHGLSVVVVPQHGTLQLPENVLFDAGKAQPKKSGQKAIKTLSEQLANLLTACAKNNDDDCPCFESIFIEGHSDKQPLKGEPKRKFITNLNLSAQRAINTYQRMKHQVAKLRNKHQQHLFGVSGYGAERPIRTRPQSANDLKGWYRDNRRITLRFNNCIPQILQKP